MTRAPELEPAPQLIKKGQLEKLLGREGCFHFSCTACGNCCEGEGRVYFTDQDLENIYSHLSLDDENKKALYKKLIQKRSQGYHVHDNSGPCYFLDSNKRCKIYPVRPLQCRSFPFWPSIFASQADLAETQAECPGMQKQDAKAFSSEESAKKINDTHEQFLRPQTKTNKHIVL